MRIALLALLAIVFSTRGAAADEAKVDPKESKITFVGSKPDGTKHDGGFTKITGAVDVQATPEESSIKIEIDATTIYADNERLTNHLKSGDFFNIRKYPKITFESTKIAVNEEEHTGVITGKLTMVGVTKEIEVPIKVEEAEEHLTLNASFKIDRTKFEINYGGAMINNDVEVTAKIRINRPE